MAETRPLVGTGAHLRAVELRAWTRFLDSSRLLEEALARHLKDQHDMLHAEYEILVRTDGFGGRVRMSQLADQIVASPSRLSHTIDRLEERGWVRRDAVPTDGRGFDIVLEEPGRRALADSAREHAQLIRQHLLAEMSDDEMELVADLLDTVIDKLRVHRSGTG